ncbi:hypothetical protein L226DRAFT_184677 [Lentinus tigrinus ALCF2SS1-7]|uniref:Uncharacterized protein n=1 Tax=Lentinus tigrinus ALCF2SS1-6 TaxID=1328759 RepID=A0A5C2SS64_9APHY|nr:hypothetical protein L227DRAFT_648770 [Lentinus tigrinus ALCF2SS1-6]RPD79904.1 hypothetical protein L226DRAFT_184677 [Lentinus tigrinus ALCF2SS1-7]
MTTTMAEPFDAQMSDAGDIDISMYPTMATSESWLTVEASMGDETSAMGTATFEYVQDGIEVEMGDDDEAITEYEMADGDGYDGQEELQDVEVYDISQAASPRMFDNHGATDNQQFEDTEPMHIPSDDPVPASEQVAPSVEPAMQVSDAGETCQQTEGPIVVVQDSSAVQQEQDEAATAHAAVPEAQFADGPSASSGGDNLPVVQPLGTTPPASGVQHLLSPSEVADHAAAESVSHPQPDPASSYEDDYQAHLAGDSADSADQQGRVYGSVEFDAVATNESGDPHEISEGVYIDPPPPVLLSLPPSAEFGECSLFNLPASSVPQSPSSSSRPASSEGLHLLLHDRPTLYYEPLSAVFAALREEQCIRSMPGFAEAELVLDAFDLQLCISEDNVYTHEVTLHELNVIHDGSDLNGPLRLRLKVYMPRFVTRYTSLRDQIARLNLTDGDDSHGDVAPAPSMHEPDTEHGGANPAGRVSQENSPRPAEPHTDGTVDEVHTETTSEDVPSALSNTSEDVVQEQAETEVAAQIAAELAGGDADAEADAENPSKVASEGGAADNVESTAYPAADDVAEDFDEGDGEYEESEETLDADEVHEQTPEQGGDYIEHAEFPDDEEELGEDLPEELDGQTTDQAYPHVDAADDTTQYAEDEEEIQGYPDDSYGADLAHHDDTGLNDEESTDSAAHSNSLEAPGGVEDQQTSSPDVHPHDATNLGTDAAPQHDSATATDEDELDDNWDDPELSPVRQASAEQLDSLSRKSSTTTLASRTSKRAYEEVELDDFDDDDEFAPESPDAKRARVE